MDPVVELLSTGDIRLLGLMPGASNFTFLAEVTLGNRSMRAVYKPRDGEAPLWDFPEGTLYRREVAAWLVAEALGWWFVPPTVVRDGPHGLGSLQKLVRARPDEHYFTLKESRSELLYFAPSIVAFDVVVNNADRKSGHVLVDDEVRLALIDHGLCFSVEPKLRTVIWDHAGERLPDGMAEQLRALAAAIRSSPLRLALGEAATPGADPQVALRSRELRVSLLGLLSLEEVEATADRAEALAAAGVLPFPTGERPYPWPAV